MDTPTASGESPGLIDRHVGSRIRQRRQELGLSQKRLAASVGLTFQQVQKYESGANRVSASKLWELAIALKASPTFFFEGLPGAPAATPLPNRAASGFMGQPEVRELAESFARLPKGAMRRRVVELVRTLAAGPPGDGDDAGAGGD